MVNTDTEREERIGGIERKEGKEEEGKEGKTKIKNGHNKADKCIHVSVLLQSTTDSVVLRNLERPNTLCHHF